MSDKKQIEEVAANIKRELAKLESDGNGGYSALGQGIYRIGSGLRCLSAAAEGKGIPS